MNSRWCLAYLSPRALLLLLLITPPVWATPDGGSSRSLTFLCAAKDRVLFLENKTTNPGSYYGNDHDFTWVTVHLDTAKVVRDAIAHLKVSRDPDDPDERSAVVAEHPAGRPLDVILRQEGHMCGAEDPPWHSTEWGMGYQQRGDQLVLSLSGASRSIPWKSLRVTSSGAPLDCEEGPCTPSIALRIGKRELLIFSMNQGDEAFIVAPKDQLDQTRSQLLNEVGFAAHKKGDYQTSARLFSEALRLDHGNRTALYNAACAKARLGEAARAVNYLRRLPNVAETRRKVRNDKDFDQIRASPELREFMSGAADGGP